MPGSGRGGPAPSAVRSADGRGRTVSGSGAGGMGLANGPLWAGTGGVPAMALGERPGVSGRTGGTPASSVESGAGGSASGGKAGDKSGTADGAGSSSCKGASVLPPCAVSMTGRASPRSCATGRGGASCAPAIADCGHHWLGAGAMPCICGVDRASGSSEKLPATGASPASAPPGRGGAVRETRTVSGISACIGCPRILPVWRHPGPQSLPILYPRPRYWPQIEENATCPS